MKIFLLTPVYALTTGKDAATPVVHYFAKEWVKQGHDVTVFHLDTKYPSFFYYISKLFQKRLVSFFNTSIPIVKPIDYEKCVEGIKIYGLTYTKYIPHSRISKKERNRILNKIVEVCNISYIPDVFIGHWEHPQLDLLPILKTIFKRPVCLVFHSNDFVLEKSFGKDFDCLLKEIDIIGFRNISAERAFKRKYWTPQKTILAQSGVSDVFINEGSKYSPVFTKQITDFVFVGIFLERKYPLEVLNALNMSYTNDIFNLTYVGDGILKSVIEKKSRYYNRNVLLTGRLPRYEVIEQLKKNQVFVMISKEEIFGLVYLEAMALGLITIGSRGEGIDGIIVDGVNGFLCTPGDELELKMIINKVRRMAPAELKKMSENAKKTAITYSDMNCAKRYLDQVSRYL